MRLGIDVGGTKLLAVALDDAGTPGAPTRVSTPDDHDGLVAAVRDLVEQHDGVTSVGLGLPCAIHDGEVVHSPNLPALLGTTVAELRAAVGTTVAIDNDANCAALAEWRLGTGAATDDLLLVTLGTGVGGGIVCAGRLVRGRHGFGGEVGHLVVEPDGRACPCGQRGCWEQYASGTALTAAGATITDLPGEGAVGPRTLQAARDGHVAAAAVVEAWVDWVARGLVSLLNVCDPEVVVLGGGVAASADAFLPALRRRVADGWGGTERAGPPRIEVSSFGPVAGAVGAALLPDEPD